MLATGASLVLSYKELLKYGKPSQVFVVTAIASEQGVQYVKKQIPNAIIFSAAIDKELTAKSYIVPGLGDAGDLAFGEKK
jgi:uracil phosphoribosyltransferase